MAQVINFFPHELALCRVQLQVDLSQAAHDFLQMLNVLREGWGEDKNVINVDGNELSTEAVFSCE